MLRAEEKKKDAAAQKPKAGSALQDYLAKKYAGGDDGGADGAGAKKKRKKAKGADVSETIRIVDQDLSGFGAGTAGKGAGRPLMGRAFSGDDDGDEDDDDDDRGLGRTWGVGRGRELLACMATLPYEQGLCVLASHMCQPSCRAH